METTSFKEISSKMVETIVSLIGAFLVVLYHGPRVFTGSSSPYPKLRQLLPLLPSSNSDWIINGCLLAITGTLISVAFILQAIFNPAYYVIHLWVVHHRGPVYLAIFKPLSIFIAAIMGAIFLGDFLYLGSLVGGILIALGFYTVLWGKAKEEKIQLWESKRREDSIVLTFRKS